MTDPYALRMTAVPRPQGGPQELAWWVNVSLPWFRAVPFSCLERVELQVDGYPVAADALLVRLDGDVVTLASLAGRGDYWGVQTTLQIGLPAGAAVPEPGASIEAAVTLRMPEGHDPKGDWTRRRVSAVATMGHGGTSPWSLGVCTFSFAGELRRGRALRACLDEVAAIGGYAGVELLGAQVAQGYPNPSSAEIRQLGTIVRDAGLVPLVYGAYTDPGRQLGPSTDDDLLNWAQNGLDTAALLGSSFARINLPPKAGLLSRATELAAQRNLVLLTELHAVTSADPYVQDLLAAFTQIDSPNLGLTLDLSCVMQAIPDGFVDELLRPALPAAAIDAILDGWAADQPEGETLDALAALGGDDLVAAARPLVGRMRRLFRRSSPDWLPDVLPHTKVVHGKFFEIVDGHEAAVPLEEIFHEFRAAEFDGHLLAEFEGHLWQQNPDTFEQLRRYRYLAGALVDA
ncbi:hypothetical protein MRBLMI12_004397 [Microbacterium sp. LMI12-1-1.1]|uniref:sugar phosphate isomerase/epimerase family protein n=1 Tax=Microbacterium sp. LMI12-1-1.1 TaxID=3135225 RepID=UPI0034155DF5